jgi:hypothetical protein
VTTLHCPAGTCTRTETYDPTHSTPDPAVPASSDTAHDGMVAHLVNAHRVPKSEAGSLVSRARRTP